MIGALAPPVTGKLNSACLPFGAMAISGYLKSKGIECKVVSTAFPDAKKEIRNNLDCDFVGISTMTGNYLNYAIYVAKMIKKLRPRIPIVWGGAHASLMSDELIKESYVDCVIKGQGEIPFYNLIKGTVTNEKFNIEKMPQLDYGFSPYSQSLCENEIGYFSSRGCPMRCTFCVASQIYGGKWWNKSEEKVFNELKELYELYHYKSIFFWDDNMLVDPERALRIIRRLNDMGIKFEWRANCRLDVVAKMSDETLKEIKETGNVWLNFGGESGSQRVLNMLNKNLKVSQIKTAARKLGKYDLNVNISFMGGIIGETEKDFSRTLALLRQIRKIAPKLTTRIYRFIPYPKMPIVNESIIKHLPKTTEGWGKVSYQSTRFPWVPRKVDLILKTLSPLALLNSMPKIIAFRLMHSFYLFPIEGWFLDKVYTYFEKRELRRFCR
jgi:radical SAM superfamily enzyme YgiQ (UPF0313 family)